MRVLIGHRRDNGTFDRASDHNNFYAHLLPCWHCNEDATCDPEMSWIRLKKTRTQSNSSGTDHEMVEISFGSFSMQIIFVALYHSQVATSHLLVTLVSMWSVCAGVAALFHWVRAAETLSHLYPFAQTIARVTKISQLIKAKKWQWSWSDARCMDAKYESPVEVWWSHKMRTDTNTLSTADSQW